jgi:hypothetical protein
MLRLTAYGPPTSRSIRNDRVGYQREQETLHVGRVSSTAHTENVIFSAIKAILPAVYARNPTAEFTSIRSWRMRSWCEWNQALEALCDALGSLKQAPGINLKYKVKQAIVSAKLMNLAWVECGYTLKEDSSDQAYLSIYRVCPQRLEKAKDSKEIAEVEGELIALEEKVNTLAPSGPYTQV